ncbi:hypothetical protein PLICRDRAFT_29884 [Plicaturopsis crispa FD-325 SS-3]|nr:hypothetical protein PLICRDRAFT_29884 [Plicaturopsis crispa FD-325 SS-3]
MTSIGVSPVEHVYPPSQVNETDLIAVIPCLDSRAKDSEATPLSDHTNNLLVGDHVGRDNCNRTLPQDAAASSESSDPELPRAQSPSSFDLTGDTSRLSLNVHGSGDVWESLSPPQRVPPSEQDDTVTQGSHYEFTRRVATMATGLSGTLALILNFASPVLSSLDVSSKAYNLGLVTRFLLYSSFVTSIACGLAAAAMSYMPYVPQWVMQCCVLAVVGAILQGLGGVGVFVMTMEDTALAVAVIGQLAVCVLFILLCGLSTYGPTRAGILDGLRVSGE